MDETSSQMVKLAEMSMAAGSEPQGQSSSLKLSIIEENHVETSRYVGVPINEFDNYLDNNTLSQFQNNIKDLQVPFKAEEMTEFVFD